MAVTINGTTGVAVGTGSVTFPDSSTQNTAAKTGMVNRIINGGMMIDQRNAGAAVTHSGGSDLYVIDRMVCNSNGTPQFSVQQVADAPAGFKFSAKLLTTTSGTPAAGDFSYFGQYIEGFNVADLGFGSAAASTVTVSFWVKSSLTGTFGGALRNNANNRSYPFSYAINAANTWEQKTVTIAGDTSGTWTTDNTAGMKLVFDTGSGANNKGTAGAWNATANIGVTGGVNLVATASATWQVTGVQLEKGSTATSFDYRPYGTELALCQRYYAVVSASGVSFTALAYYQGAGVPAQHPVTMRATPTYTVISNGTRANLNGGPYFTPQNQYAGYMSFSGNASPGYDFYVLGATASATAEL